ncbi:MAG: beta-ketoacyl-[acyl-carrier-protein] synthase family protein [Bacteroidota bacterium]
MNRRVVVTGMGVVSPIGTGIQNFLLSLKTGKSGIRFIPELKELNFGCQVGGIPDESVSPFLEILDKYNLNAASNIIRYAIIAAIEAWMDAGLIIPEFQSSEVDYNTGSIIGSGIGPADIFGSRIIPLTNEKNIKRLRSTIVEHSMLSGASANLAGILALGNRISFNSSACSTSTESIILSYELIKSGKAERMISGGSEAYSPYGWSGFDAMRVIARKFNENPEQASRPMSESADGFVPGAGAGILILEELNSAINRKAKIYGEIVGAYINSGGQRNGGTMTAPNSEGVIRCITGAINDANIHPDQIDYISGHLSSTMADILEIRNWADALNRKGISFPYINSLKSLTGHCIGAAGAIETIATILEMNHQFLHPSLNCRDFHPEITSVIDEEKVTHNTINNVII